jgi:hypothetical protein
LLAGDAGTATTDVAALLDHPGISSVFIATRHDEHGALARSALLAGKSAWVEKPLALTEADLDATMAVARASASALAVGFNRRFAPLAVRLRAALAAKSGPRRFTVDVNAGRLPADHWTLDPKQGGDGSSVRPVTSWISCASFPAARSLTFVVSLAISTVRTAAASNCTSPTAISPRSITVPISRRTCPRNGSRSPAKVWSAEIDNWRSLRAQDLPGASARPAWLGGPARGKGHAEALAAFSPAPRRLRLPNSKKSRVGASGCRECHEARGPEAQRLS